MIDGWACVVEVVPRVEPEVAVVEDAAAFVADSPAAGNSLARISVYQETGSLV